MYERGKWYDVSCKCGHKERVFVHDGPHTYGMQHVAVQCSKCGDFTYNPPEAEPKEDADDTLQA